MVKKIVASRRRRSSISSGNLSGMNRPQAQDEGVSLEGNFYVERA